MKFNVVLTLIEMAALVIVVPIGFWVMAKGDADMGRIVVFDSQSDRGLFLAVTVATAIAFFAMVGFEDSVNMVEETQDPVRIFPRVMFTGLGIAVVFYVLVALSVIAVIPEGQIEAVVADEGQGAARGRREGRARPPDRQGLPVPHGGRGRQHRAAEHADGQPAFYGLAHQDVLPRTLGKVLLAAGRRTPGSSSTLLALGLIVVVTFYADTSLIVALSGTTALLLLCVFAVVNVASSCCAGTRGPRAASRRRAGSRFRRRRSPACSWRDRGPATVRTGSSTRSPVALLLLGIVLWACTWFTNRAVRAQKTGFRDIEHMED